MNKDLFLRVYENRVLNVIINNKIRYIHNRGCKDPVRFTWDELTQTPKVLAQYGYLDQFKLISAMLNNDNHSRPYCCQYAARYGHFHILKYVIENHKPPSYEIEDIFKSALHGGSIPIIEYVYSLRAWDPSHHKQLFALSAQSGRVEVCEWFVNQFKGTDEMCSPYNFYFYATLSGSVDVLKWGIEYFKNIKEETSLQTMWTCSIKNVELLDFLYNHELFKSTFNLKKLMAEAVHSNFNVIDWFFSKVDDITSLDDKDIYISLIFRGNLRVIKYFASKLGYKKESHKNEAEWFFMKCQQLGFNPIDQAIEFFQKHKLIIWMYENTDFKATVDPLQACENSLDLLKWFTENNRPETIPTSTLNTLVTFSRHTQTVEYIIKNRTEQFPDFSKLIEFLLLNTESKELINKLTMNREVNFTPKTMDRAISKNRLEAVKWIHKNTTAKCTENGIKRAYLFNDSAMITWLDQNRTESCDPEYIKGNFLRFSASVQSFIRNNKPNLIPSLYK